MKKETKNKKEDQIERLRKQVKDRARKIIELTLQHTSFLSMETVLPDVAATLLSQYTEAATKGESTRMIQLKNQMFNDGITPPL